MEMPLDEAMEIVNSPKVLAEALQMMFKEEGRTLTEVETKELVEAVRTEPEDPQKRVEWVDFNARVTSYAMTFLPDILRRINEGADETA
jgi:hypothetical protein